MKGTKIDIKRSCPRVWKNCHQTCITKRMGGPLVFFGHSHLPTIMIYSPESGQVEMPIGGVTDPCVEQILLCDGGTSDSHQCDQIFIVREAPHLFLSNFPLIFLKQFLNGYQIQKTQTFQNNCHSSTQPEHELALTT